MKRLALCFMAVVMLVLAERTTRFTFTATGFTVFDTIFNDWEDTVDIVLSKE
jgi:hypothetical protein